MTIFSRRHDDDENARALNDYLDDLASGVLAPRDEIEPDIATVASQWKQVGARTAEPPGLRTQLWEDLMNSATSLEAGSLAAPLAPDIRRIGDDSARLGTPSRRLTARPRHLMEMAAVAIIVLGIVAVSLIGRGGGGGNPNPTSALMAPFLGTPEVPCGQTSSDPWTDCPHVLESVGINFVYRDDLVPDVRPTAEIQGWAIAAGKSSTGVTPASGTQGAAVDFVLNGAYTATFTVPVVVSRGGYTNRPIEYLDPGATVELVRGDSVSYKLGGLVEIQNPLTSERLEFKRAVIYTGDISAFSAVSDGVTTRSEGSTLLSFEPGKKSAKEVSVQLYYLSKPQGTNTLPPWWYGSGVIGPVDPQTGPQGENGFALVIAANLG